MSCLVALLLVQARAWVRPWKGLRREAVESLSLEASAKHVGVALESIHSEQE